MPELPEVENVRRTLESAVRGARVSHVDLRRADFVEGDPALARTMLRGQRILEIRRHGKQLAILGESTVIGVHLGLTGSVRIHETAPPADPHLHVLWKLENGQYVAFRDPRRFGGLWVHDSVAALQTRWSALGPDALKISEDELTKGFEKKRTALKSALLDQSILAGMGNIYVDELLFTLRIHPLILAGKLKPVHIRLLIQEMRTLLTRAIDAGGSTLRDYIDARGQTGGFQLSHQVYGRSSQPCLICGSTLKLLTLQGRSTVFCPDCQKRSLWKSSNSI